MQALEVGELPLTLESFKKENRMLLVFNSQFKVDFFLYLAVSG